MVDDNVGRLLENLREQGLAENTLIVFTADHGNMLGDLNRWFKGVMYEGSSRIPLLMKVPAASPPTEKWPSLSVVTVRLTGPESLFTATEAAPTTLPA